MLLTNSANRKRTALILAVTFLIYGIAGISGADDTENPHFHDNTTTREVDDTVAIGTNVGSPVSAHYKGPDKIRYNIVDSADAGAFTIDSRSGQLKTARTLSYQAKSSYSLRVIVEKGVVSPYSDQHGPIYVYSYADGISVTINLIPDHPYFQEDSVTFSIDEEVEIGTAVGTVSAEKFGDNDKYGLTATDTGEFSLDSKTGQLTTATVLDYETKSSYSVRVAVDKAVEEIGVAKSGEILYAYFRADYIDVTINVTDRPESEPDPATAEAFPPVTSEDRARIAALLTLDRVLFSEIFNASTDTHDWVELRNISGADLDLSEWTLIVYTSGEGESLQTSLQLPAGTLLPAGNWLLLVNTDPNAPEMPLAISEDAAAHYVVDAGFVLPQADFTLVLRSPEAFEDSVGNYYFGFNKETAPALTVDTAWYRAKSDVFGHQAEAWAPSGYQDGRGYDPDAPESLKLGTPGYPHRLTGDLNNDGVVNILDLVLVAAQLGQSGETSADLNGDGSVDTQDLVIAANHLGATAAAPSAQTLHASHVTAWLHLAKVETQRISGLETLSIGKRFSYEQGVAQLEQLLATLIPKTSALLPNYPNPFNPETWIPYRLANASEVVLRIYDARGHLVRQLDLGYQPVGLYQTRSRAAYWDGRNELGESVASGLYFYTLTAGDFSATRRMLILK